MIKPAQLLRTLRELINQRGYDIVRTVPCSIPPSAASLAALIKLVLVSLGIEVLIDVGANEGQFGDFVRKLGYVGLIVSFEPATKPFRVLQKKAAADGNWLAFQLAAGSQPAVMQMTTSQASDLNSFLPVSSAGKEFLRDATKPTGVEDVKVVRLDEFLPDIFCQRNVHNAFLKLDTQGWDLEAARGAEGLMADVAAVQTEVSFQALYEGSPTYRESLDYFERRGFEVLTASPVSIDYSHMVCNEMDCLFVRPQGAMQTAAAIA